MNSSLRIITSLVVASLFTNAPCVQAQETDTAKAEKYVFTEAVRLKATPVKDQYASGTCWSFATTSFIESELMRITKDTLDLSEMFFVRKCYEQKAKDYVRRHGTANFSQGGQAHDVMNIAASGLMTEADYPGLANGQTKPMHSEMEAVLKGMLDALVKNPNGKLSPEWFNAISAVLDVYFGPLPETVSPLKGIKKFNPADYIELTSYTHHPFYQSFILEIPDNWSSGYYFNVPIDDLIATMKYALENGYTIDWDGDVSDKGFSHKNGVAIVPDVKLESAGNTERSKWESIPEKERQKQFYAFEKPIPEKTVTQEMRQIAFDNFSATDDHLMHITGITRDQNNTLYFITKNSWAADSNEWGGYLNMSEAYVRLNTIAIMVHKDALPKEIKKKLGL